MTSAIGTSGASTTLRLKGIRRGTCCQKPSMSHRLGLETPVSAVYQMLALYITAISLHAPKIMPHTLQHAFPKEFCIVRR